jgi:uncharacterized protein (TIGR00251 family)
MGSIRVGIKVVPNASREGISSWLGEDLKVRVAQPPEAGRANERVCLLLAERLRLPKDAVAVVTGHSSPRKTVEIDGITMDEFRRRVAG